MTALVDLDIRVDKDNVERALEAVVRSLQPDRLTAFHHLYTLPILREHAMNRFDSEGDEAVGGHWAPLTETRKDIRRHAGIPEGPINDATGWMKKWLKGNQGSITKARGGGGGMAFSYPGRLPRETSRFYRYTTAQAGRRAGFPMPDGHGGSKPSPSPIPARPVVGLDHLDLAHVVAALELHVIADVEKALL